MEYNEAEINRLKNLNVKKITNGSNGLAFQSGILADPNIAKGFGVLNKAFEGTAQEFAQAQLAINKGLCGDCIEEQKRVQMLQQAPGAATEFLEELTGELSVIDSENFDVNNNAEYAILKAMIDGQAGFTAAQGFKLDLDLNPMVLKASGPGFKNGGLEIAADALKSIIKSGGAMLAETPKVQPEMVDITSKLLEDQSMVQNENFSDDAKISEQFFVKEDGKFKYEQIEVGEGKARNVLVPDMERIEAKAKPFLNASIAMMLEDEESAVALYNTMLKDNVTEDEQLQSDETKNAGNDSWVYRDVLPLSKENKKIFADSYKRYWNKNYLEPFVKNQLPKNPADQEIFDISIKEGGKKSTEGRDPMVDSLLKEYGVIK